MVRCTGVQCLLCLQCSLSPRCSLYVCSACCCLGGSFRMHRGARECLAGGRQAWAFKHMIRADALLDSTHALLGVPCPHQKGTGMCAPMHTRLCTHAHKTHACPQNTRLPASPSPAMCKHPHVHVYFEVALRTALHVKGGLAHCHACQGWPFAHCHASEGGLAHDNALHVKVTLSTTMHVKVVLRTCI